MINAITHHYPRQLKIPISKVACQQSILAQTMFFYCLNHSFYRFIGLWVIHKYCTVINQNLSTNIFKRSNRFVKTFVGNPNLAKTQSTKIVDANTKEFLRQNNQFVPPLQGHIWNLTMQSSMVVENHDSTYSVSHNGLQPQLLR